VTDFRTNLEGVDLEPALFGGHSFDGEESCTSRMKRDGLLRNSVFGDGLSILTIPQYFGTSIGAMISIGILWTNAWIQMRRWGRNVRHVRGIIIVQGDFESRELAHLLTY
jgi:hypothetical protein